MRVFTHMILFVIVAGMAASVARAQKEVHLDPESEKLFNSIFKNGDNANKQAGDRDTAVTNVGCELYLPGKWLEQRAAVPWYTGERQYVWSKDKDVCVNFLRDGARLSAESAARIKGVLDAGGIVEIGAVQKLENLLKDRADPEVFQVKKAAVENIQGKRILIVSGAYKKEDLCVESIFAPVSPSCDLIMEIKLFSSTEKFPDAIALFDKALKSLVWEPPPLEYSKPH